MYVNNFIINVSKQKGNIFSKKEYSGYYASGTFFFNPEMQCHDHVISIERSDIKQKKTDNMLFIRTSKFARKIYSILSIFYI